jgi:hypothetical protein
LVPIYIAAEDKGDVVLSCPLKHIILEFTAVF